MSLSRLLVGTLSLGIILSASACQISVKTKQKIVGQNLITKATDWHGEEITISSEGVGVSSNGGVTVNVDPAATTVSATVRLAALAYEKSDGEASIADATNTFSVSLSGGKVVVTCPHGGTHGDSDSGGSGCELMTVTIPAGNATTPLLLTVLSGNDNMNLNLASATIKNLGANQNGTGDIIASLPATQGGNISLISQEAGDLTVTMPGTFSADQVLLQADADKISNAFTDIVPNGGGRGTAGTGLKLLSLKSNEFAGSTGKITLSQ